MNSIDQHVHMNSVHSAWYSISALNQNGWHPVLVLLLKYKDTNNILDTHPTTTTTKKHCILKKLKNISKHLQVINQVSQFKFNVSHSV